MRTKTHLPGEEPLNQPQLDLIKGLINEIIQPRIPNEKAGVLRELDEKLRSDRATLNDVALSFRSLWFSDDPKATSYLRARQMFDLFFKRLKESEAFN